MVTLTDALDSSASYYDARKQLCNTSFLHDCIVVRDKASEIQGEFPVFPSPAIPAVIALHTRLWPWLNGGVGCRSNIITRPRYEVHRATWTSDMDETDQIVLVHVWMVMHRIAEIIIIGVLPSITNPSFSAMPGLQASARASWCPSAYFHNRDYVVKKQNLHLTTSLDPSQSS